MRTFFAVLLSALAAGAAARAVPADDYPHWAYGFATPGDPATISSPFAGVVAADSGSLRSVAGSALKLTLAQIHDGFAPADWYADEHPAMPEIVAHGKKPNIRACSLCHYPNGKGRPENAAVSGLPYAYVVQTMADFKSGARKSADPRKTNTKSMASFAQLMSDDEIKASAEYFSSIKWTPWIEVVETPMAPKTRIVGGMFMALEGSGKEPIGDRIIEVPQNTEATETLRDSHSGFIAYAPPGSLQKGEALVKAGACGVCHGADLLGLGPVPGIAGRSPSYVVRQMYDMKMGARAGLWSDLMKPVVARLSAADMLAIAAYTASLPQHH